ncbi:MAG: viroplasmin family protein [Saprospiraceae bacterium]|nr:viroplasmin family protein [Saprospiraceae bacterium]
MAKKQKYYVVWAGVKPGIYPDWNDAKAQIEGFTGAKYKSFESRDEAEKAFRESHVKYYNYTNKTTPSVPTSLKANLHSKQSIIQDSICVDAACSGNPGLMEYRGVYTKTREQIFHQGPFRQGTNNIGEFLALVHGLAFLKREGKHTMPIYSDSRTAIAWVRNKKAKTELKETPANEAIFDLIERAETWLKNNTYSNPITKWETEIWGEIPADFGRKG